MAAYPALALQPQTFDPVGVLQAAQGIQNAQLRNRLTEMELALAPERNALALEGLRRENTLAQLNLTNAQERQGALAQFRTQGGVGSPQALSALAGHPDLLAQALSGMDAMQRMNVARNARDAQYVLGMLSPEGQWTPDAQAAWRSRLSTALQERRIDQDTHDRLANSAQPPRELLQNVVRMGQAVPSELEAAHAEVYRADAAAKRAQMEQRQAYMRLLTGAGSPSTAPAPAAPPAPARAPSAAATLPPLTQAEPLGTPVPGAPGLTVGPTTSQSVADLRAGRYGANVASIGMGLGRYVEAITAIDPSLDPAAVRTQFGQLLRQHGNPLDAASALFTGQPLSDANAEGAEYARRFVRTLEGGNSAPTMAAPPAPSAPASAAAPRAPAATSAPRTVGEAFRAASEVEQAEILALIGDGKEAEAMKRLREIDEGQKVQGENAARVAMIQTGLEGMPRARNVFQRPWNAGDWGRAFAGGGTALWDFPNLSGEMGMARRDVNILVESVLRAMTGAAAPTSEVAQYAAMFMPMATDSVDSAKQKLDRLETFAQRYLTLLQVGRVDRVSTETARQRLQELANGASVDTLLPSGPAAPASSGGYRVLGVR